MSVATRRYLLVAAGLGLGGAGLWTSFGNVRLGPSNGVELLVLAVLAVAAGLFSFVTINPAGAIVVINPALSFTFAILLRWGLVPALSAQVAAVAALTWRRRLPPLRGLLMAIQFVAAFLVAYALLRFSGAPIGPEGRQWTRLDDAGLVIASVAVWLIAFTLFGYVFTAIGPRFGAQIPPPTGYGMLFNAALVVLSPVVAATAEVNLAFAALVLIPLFATQRMARLSAERDRTNRLDPLTSLANRARLRERFDRLVATCGYRPGERSPRRIAMLLLDLDRFKHVNDSLGHDVGDSLLVEVASRLSTIDTGGGLVARLGGDEFAVLACVPDASDAEDLAVRAVELLRDPVTLQGLLVDVTASVGLALRGPAGEDFAALLRHADAAMYEAKRRGDAIAIYNRQTDTEAPELMRLLADFRQALQADDDTEITMHYQPQVSLPTGTVDGLEALLRWTHPVLGSVDAATIVTLAEYTSVMRLLTERVIDSVTEQIAQWRSEGLTPRVAINISARDLYSEDIVEQLGQRLREHRLSPHQLQVEITESALMADPTRARATLRRIAELGIDISLDDFGTGYSSLQHLRRIPLSEIKIDQTFVSGMTRNNDDAAIVASTIKMAHALGLRAVAEGVADEPTRRLLADLGCDLGQGWHISPAVPGDRVGMVVAAAAGSGPK
jgi:diguanylate cyclase (GGDEF)-like protein